MKIIAVLVATLVMFWVVFINQGEENTPVGSLTPARAAEEGESAAPRPLAKAQDSIEQRVVQVVPVGSPVLDPGETSEREAATIAPTPKAKNGPNMVWVDVTVVDSNREPIGRVDLLLEPAGDNSLTSMSRRFQTQDRSRATTDKFGKARMEAMKLGLLRVTASAEGFADGASDVFRLAKWSPDASVEIELTSGGSVAGQLQDIHGDPANKIRVSIHLSAWAREVNRGITNVMQSIDTDNEGSFLFTHVTPGKYTLYTRAEGEDQERVPSRKLSLIVIDGETTHVEFEDLSESYVKLSGIVLHNDSPAPFASVNFGWSDRSRGYLWKKTKADEEGRFKITLDEGGEYRIQISRENAKGSVFQECSIPSEASHEIEIRFYTGGIRGHVFGPDGSPVPNFKVMALGKYGEDGVSVYNTTTNESGEYQLTEIIAATYHLRSDNSFPSPEPSPSTESPYLGIGESEGLEVTAGATLHDADLQLSAAGAVAVTVIDSEGNPVDSAEVRIRAMDDSIRSALPTRGLTDDQGVYLGGGLADGHYVVTATLGKQVSHAVPVVTHTNTTASVELYLETGVKVSCAALLNGEPGNGCYVRLFNSDGLVVATGYSRDGQCVIGPVVPGSYQIHAEHTRDEEKFQDEQVLTITGLEPVSVELDMD